MASPLDARLRCHQNPFVGALRIQEPDMKGVPINLYDPIFSHNFMTFWSTDCQEESHEKSLIKDYVFGFYYHLLILMVFHYLIGILILFSFTGLLFYKFVFWKSIHLEVALESFCFLINSSWLLIFTLIIILFIFTGFNLYCWTGIHFS